MSIDGQPDLPAGEGSAQAPSTPSEAAEPLSGFKKFGLSEELLRGIAEMGYEQPLPVQDACFDLIRRGRDMLIRSKTGTGKTAAFGIPLIDMVTAGQTEPQVLVLTPTRELAAQVADEIAGLSKYKKISCQAIYGGASMQNQLSAIRAGVEFVVGTPGRILDHLRRGSLDLSKVKTCVLDEADEMLSMGFYEEVSRILDALPEQRQVLLLSATLPHDIERLAGKYLREPETVDISGDDLTVEGIDNILYFTNETLPKPRSLLYLLAVENPQSAIIFCNTREDTTYVGAYLRREGFDAEVINSDLSQTAREQVMGKIKQGKLRFLVATDIAARGIDISDLSHVINYSLPESPEVYLHRVGRTGRVGRKGVALSLIEGREINTLRAIKRMYRVTFEERKLPTPDEYRKLLDRRRLSQLAAEAAAADTVRYAALAERVIANEEATHLVAYLLKSWDDKSLAAALSAVSATEPAGETLAAPEAEPGRERERGRDRDRDRGRRRGRRGERERGRESAGGEESREGDRGRDRDRGRERNRDRDRDRPRDRDRDRERDRDRPADASRAPRISPYARELVPEGWEAVRHESDEIPEEPAPEAAPSEARPAVVKVHLNVGYADGFRESQITQAIAEIAGIPATEITKVTPHRRYSFFCVPAERLEQVLSTVQGREVQGKTLTAEKAKERR